MRLVVAGNTTRTGLSNNAFDNMLTSQKRLHSSKQTLHTLIFQFLFFKSKLCTGVYRPEKKCAWKKSFIILIFIFLLFLTLFILVISLLILLSLDLFSLDFPPFCHISFPFSSVGSNVPFIIFLELSSLLFLRLLALCSNCYSPSAVSLQQQQWMSCNVLFWIGVMLNT